MCMSVLPAYEGRKRAVDAKILSLTVYCNVKSGAQDLESAGSNRGFCPKLIVIGL